MTSNSLRENFKTCKHTHTGKKETQQETFFFPQFSIKQSEFVLLTVSRYRTSQKQEMFVAAVAFHQTLEWQAYQPQLQMKER